MNDITWKKFVEALDEQNEISEAVIGNPDMLIEGLTYNSMEVHKGTLFVCKGVSFKKEYLVSAVEKGAAAYVSEIDYSTDDDGAPKKLKQIPHIIVKDIRKSMPLLARTYYHFPEEALTRIGLTGTSGKTTTAYCIKSIFDEWLKNEGKEPMAIFSSIELDDGAGIEIAPNQTTPESMELYRRFQNAYDNKREYLVMEVSSQALKVDRTLGVPFDTGVFVNISNDHVSPVEHLSYEDYISSKLKFFKQVKTAVINIGSDDVDRVMEAASECEKIVTFAAAGQKVKDVAAKPQGTGCESKEDLDKADYRLQEVAENEKGLAFTITGPGFDEEFTMPMCGLFNAMNALAAVAVCHSRGIGLEHIKEGLSKVMVPGHMEMHPSPDGKIMTIVDYAHNGLSFETVFKSARNVYPDRKLICIFGCSGGKAINRREDEGRASGKNCDLTYVTMDYPDMETVWDISQQIGKGIEAENGKWVYVEDRIEAVRKAVNDLDGPAVICILGRGAEKAQKINHELIPYPSDGEIIEMIYEESMKGKL